MEFWTIYVKTNRGWRARWETNQRSVVVQLVGEWRAQGLRVRVRKS